MANEEETNASAYDDTLQEICGDSERKMKLHKKEAVNNKESKIIKQSNVLVAHGNGNNLCIKRFDIGTNSFTEYITNGLIDIRNVNCNSFCLYRGLLYLYKSGKDKRWFWYENDRKTWSKLPEMISSENTNHFHICTIAYKDRLLIIGGNDHSVECFNVAQNRWTAFPSTIKLRHNAASVVYRDCVFVTGGYEHGAISSVEMFDSNKNKWIMAPSMNQERYYHASEVYQDKIYVAGGLVHCFGLCYVETFAGGETWTSVQCLNAERCSFGMFVHDKTLYVLGGDMKSGSSSYEIFDEENNKWKSLNVEIDQLKMCKVFVL